MDRLGRAGEHVEEGESTARPDDPRDLAVEARLVRDVHRCVLRPADVEACVRERHPKGARMDERDLLHEVRPGRERLAHGAVLGRQIQNRHVTAEPKGELPGRPPNPAADVEEAIGRVDLGGVRERQGASETIRVVVIDRGELIDRHVPGIDALAPDLRFDRLHQARPAVMGADALVEIVHPGSLPATIIVVPGDEQLMAERTRQLEARGHTFGASTTLPALGPTSVRRQAGRGRTMAVGSHAEGVTRPHLCGENARTVDRC